MINSKAVLLGCFILFGFLAFMARGKSHEAPSGWQYPLECCSNQDCKPIPSKLVWESKEGFEIAPSEGGGFVPRGKERVSPDGDYHLCRSQYSGTILCLFVPPRGV